MMDEAIPLPDRRKGIVPAGKISGGHRLDRGEPKGNRPASSDGNRRSDQRTGFLINIRFFHPKHIHQKFPQFGIAVASQLQSDGTALLPFLMDS